MIVHRRADLDARQRSEATPRACAPHPELGTLASRSDHGHDLATVDHLERRAVSDTPQDLGAAVLQLANVEDRMSGS